MGPVTIVFRMKLFLILLVGIAVAAPPPPPFPPAPAYLNFTKSSNVDTVQSAGQTIYYVITAENKGTTNINIQKTSDPFLESSGTPLVCVPDITKAYTLKPAEKAQCTGSYTVTQADINNGNDILNSATIIEQTPKGIQTYSSNLVRVMIAKKALQVRYEGLTITDQGLLDMNPGELIIRLHHHHYLQLLVLFLLSSSSLSTSSFSCYGMLLE